MKKVGVVTTTFNRVHLLEKLYKSLLKQTCKDFVWIVIDDGSEDNTQDYIKRIMFDNHIEIKYRKTLNQGKHRALNVAIDICENELFFIVDSDDSLPLDAIEKIIQMEQSIPYEEKKYFCGISGLKSTPDKLKIFSNPIKNDVLDANYLESTYKFKMGGDKAEVYYTNVLKKYKFPYFGDERFLTESIVWSKIASDGYLIRWFKEIIYFCDYLPDGLTSNSYNLFVKNPIGKMQYHNFEASYQIPLKYKLYHQINYYRFGYIAKYDTKYLNKNRVFAKGFLFSSLFGYILYLLTLRKFNKLNKNVV